MASGGAAGKSPSLGRLRLPSVLLASSPHCGDEGRLRLLAVDGPPSLRLVDDCGDRLSRARRPSSSAGGVCSSSGNGAVRGDDGWLALAVEGEEREEGGRERTEDGVGDGSTAAQDSA